MTSTHFRTTQMRATGDVLRINGMSLEQLLWRAGRTPFYAYDRALIDQRIGELRSSLPDSVKLHYAMKANPMPALVNHVAQQVDGIDVASHGELRWALDAGVDPQCISFAGPGKTLTELRAAIASGVCVSVESSNELANCGVISQEIGRPARIALRINPDFELKQSGMKMTGKASQFGIDIAEVKTILHGRLPETCELVGLQVFSGSQNLNTDALIQTTEQTFDLVISLIKEYQPELEFVNVGGGYGIPYFPGEVPFDLARVSASLGECIAANRDTLGKTEVVVELGRYLVGEAGFYICRISDIKLSKGKKFIIVDGGLHHHLSNSGNFGQVLRKNYPVVIGNKLSITPCEEATIVGPLCTPLDIVAADIELPPVELGDFVVVAQSGAYGYSASPLNFLGHDLPVELLV